MGILSSQVDVVRVVFQTTGVGFSTVASTEAHVVLGTGALRAGHGSTNTEAFTQVISDRTANAITVLTQCFTTVVSLIFTAYATVFTLILNSEVQAINQAEEIAVTVGRKAVTTLLHEVVRTVGVAAEFWQNVGPGSYIVNHTVVTTVVERTRVTKFQTGKRHTGPGVVFVLT